MNIYKFELRMYIKSILIWVVSLGALVFLFMAFYPSIAKDASLMDRILENYPEEMLKAFGMNSGLSLSSVLGFLTFLYPFVQLLLAIQSANYGFTFLSIEERELTADFLMSKPVTRKRVLLSKFFAGFTAITLTNLALLAMLIASIELFREGAPYQLAPLLVLWASNFLFQLFFIIIGMVVTVTTKKIRSVLSYSLGLAFGLYLLNAIRSIVGGELLGIPSPYYHFDASYILKNTSLDWTFALISIGVIVLGFAYTYYRYLHRNIHSV